MPVARRMKVLIILIAMFAVASVRADEVVLNNGDRITGKMVNLEDGKLSIKTEYAGVISIDWSQVKTFSTDAPAYVKIGDNTVLVKITESESGTVTLESDDLRTPESVALSRLETMSYERKPAVRVSGRINIGAASSSGNTNVENLNANAEVVARSDQNRVTLGGQVNKGKDSGKETESNWLAYLKYDHFISEKWYAFANASGENDKFKDINLRTTLGAGGGYQVLDTGKTYLLLELGANNVNTDFEVGTDQNYPAARFALDFSRKLFGSEAEFFNRDVFFNSLDDSENQFLRTRTGLRLPIVERLNSTIQYNYDWDNNPAPGRRSEDKTWLFTLGYRW